MPMTNPIALWLAALIALALLVDALVFGGAGALFLARKTFLLIDWLAFWR